MQFPDKSKPAELPPKKVEKIVDAVPVKRPATRRFLDQAFADSPRNIGRRIFDDIMVPNIKRGLEQAAGAFISGMLWGDTGGSMPSNVVRGNLMRVSGNSYSQMSTQNAMQLASRANTMRSGGGYKDLTLASADEAQMLLARMYELLNDYRVVAVGDLYEAAGITPSISDNSYGWTSLDGARISQTRDGFLLELPRPISI